MLNSVLIFYIKCILLIKIGVKMNTEYETIFKFITDSSRFCYAYSEVSKIPELKYLFIKNFRNINAIEILLTNEEHNCFYQEAATILRSFIESSINFIYLLFFEQKRLVYQEDSQLLVFKNNFMWHKKALNHPEELINELGATVKQFEAELVKSFNKLSNNNKTKILNGIKQKSFTVDKDVCSELDKFLKNYKSQFMNIRKMCEELSAADITVNGLNFKDIINETYNEYSQITHTIFPIEKKEITERVFDIIRNCFTMNNAIVAVLHRKYNLMLPENLGIQLKACSEVLEKHIRI